MTIEEIKDAQDVIINKLMGISGLLDLLPHSFEQNGYDINAKVVKHCDETILQMIEEGKERIKEIGIYLHNLKETT